MTAQPLTIVHRDGSIVVVEMSSRCKLIEDALVEPLGSELQTIAQDPATSILILDLSVTEFFGSSFIETLLRLWRQFQQKPNGKLMLCGVQKYCREVLEITHLTQLWSMFPTREEALAAAKSA